MFKKGKNWTWPCAHLCEAHSVNTHTGDFHPSQQSDWKRSFVLKVNSKTESILRLCILFMVLCYYRLQNHDLKRDLRVVYRGRFLSYENKTRALRGSWQRPVCKLHPCG